MSDDIEKRLIDLEIRYTEQTALLDELNSELYRANETIGVLTRRVVRLEKMVIDILNQEELPPNEKPPHY
ncbi:MAG: SlyX family protein [Myxococcota bacterium]|nr:SlyX family protein [Myxococcota bacterium]